MTTVQEHVWITATRDPNAVALRDANQSFSYADVCTAALNFSQHLEASLAPGNQPLLLVGTPTPAYIVVLIASMLSGRPFVLSDATTPRARLRAMADASGAAAIVHTSCVEPLGYLPSIALPRLVGGHDNIPPLAARPATDPCYIHFTSGSTGKPKGVLIPHRAIVNRLLWTAVGQQLGPGDRLLVRTPPTFDASIWELLAPLVTGAESVLAEADARFDPVALINTISRLGVTALQCVPAVLRLLADTPDLEQCRTLRTVVCGGEVLEPALAQTIMKRLPEARLWNTYGPTECAIDSIMHEVRESDTKARRVPIGRPIAGVRAVCLTSDGTPCGRGIPGELALAGACVGDGYLNDAGRGGFQECDLGVGSEPIYRTGDLAMLNAAGEFEYLGRLDDQMKINGIRFEPEEIEAVARRVLGIDHVAAVPLPGDFGTTVALATAGSGIDDVKAATEAMGALLPQGVVPSIFRQIERIPILPSGKLDRRHAWGLLLDALAVEDAPPSHEEEGDETLLSKVRTIWATVLGRPGLRPDSDFFAEGGTSLKLLHVLRLMRHELSTPDIRLSDLVQDSTLRGHARSVLSSARRAHTNSLPAHGPWPASERENARWAQTISEGKLAAQFIPLALDIDNRFGVDDVTRWVVEAQKRQPALRTLIRWQDGGVRAIEDTEASTVIRDETTTKLSLSLTLGPLLEMSLGPARERGTRRLVVRLHHGVADGESAAMLVRHLQARAADLPSPLPHVRADRARTAHAAIDELASASREVALDALVSRLSGAGRRTWAVPTTSPRSLGRNVRSIEIGTTAALQRAARTARVSNAAYLAAIWLKAVSSLTSDDNGMLAVPVPLRSIPEAEGLIGDLTGVAILRCADPASLTIADCATVLHKQWQEAIGWGNVPLEVVDAALRNVRGQASPLEVYFSREDDHWALDRTDAGDAEEHLIDMVDFSPAFLAASSRSVSETELLTVQSDPHAAPRGLVDAVLDVVGASAREHLADPSPQTTGIPEGAPMSPHDALCAALATEFGPDVDLDRPFLEAGGTSVSAARLVMTARDVTGQEVPLRSIFEAPSLRRWLQETAAGSHPEGIDD